MSNKFGFGVQDCFLPSMNSKSKSNRVPLLDHRRLKRAIVSESLTIFNFIISARLISAFWSNISDCDETYNYWEPAHYLMYGKGFQTWEYSPTYALRSYAYILLHIFPIWMIQPLFHPNPIFLFYITRLLLALFCSFCEIYFYRGLVYQVGVKIGRLTLFFMALSVGMFVSSTAFLPSTTSMYLCLVSYGAWFQRNNAMAIFATALSALFSWPFAGALGVPIAFDILFRQKKIKFFILWCILSFLIITVPQVLIDWMYYGKIVFAPLNIVLYNIFTSHGPDLYGTEPWYFYILNGFLNFNVIFLASVLIVPFGLFCNIFIKGSNMDIPFTTLYMGFYLWLGIFTLQPHKEERFLFPIYPLICLGGAHFVDYLQKFYLFLAQKMSNYFRNSCWISGVIILVFSVMSCSRITALYVNYHAPTSIWVQINNIPTLYKETNVTPGPKYTVCIGKEWYRYPTSFFLPSKSWNVEFLQSDFRGQLPRHYDENDILATSRFSDEFNDKNLEEKSRYRVSTQDCDFIVDQDTGNDGSEREENYIRNKKVWKTVFNYGLLSPQKGNTSRWLRAFYIPFLSSKKNVFNSYSLLRNELRFNKQKLLKA